MALIFLNKRPIGFHENGNKFVENLRKLRRSGEIHPEVNF